MIIKHSYSGKESSPQGKSPRQGKAPGRGNILEKKAGSRERAQDGGETPQGSGGTVPLVLNKLRGWAQYYPNHVRD